MTTPFRVLGPFEPAEHRRLRRRMMFDAFKWDPQVGDTCTIGRFALAIRDETWNELARSAEALAAETLAAEQELLRRPEWHGELGLPRAIRRVLRDGKEAFPSAAARVIRFDFHHTVDGWRISEANTDVPGGFNEAEGLAEHVAQTHPDLEPCGLPAVDLARSLAAAADPSAGVVALVHATAYTDDLQVMLHLERRLRERGFTALPAAPDHLRHAPGRLELLHEGRVHPLCAAVRFFPADWLPNLSGREQWDFWFRGSPTPLCNPGAALLTQAKRFPLLWDRMHTPLTAWRRLLPETRDPRDAPVESDEWVVKPNLGRVGEGVGLAGATPAKALAALRREAGRHPRAWVAQRRFDNLPVAVEGVPWTVCLGVYTVNGRAAGVYGRASPSPLVAATACDVAILKSVSPGGPSNER